MGKDWIISPAGNSMEILSNYRFGEGKIFGTKDKDFPSFTNSIIGEYGVAIINRLYDSYEGFISFDQKNNKVIRISFSGVITDTLFLTPETHADDFTLAFRQKYDMPEFDWIKRGWTYESPNGYKITIMLDKFLDIKFLDIKKEENIKPINKPKINFD